MQLAQLLLYVCLFVLVEVRMALVSVPLHVATERPETIYIGTRSRFTTGEVWRYQLSHVGEQRIYVCLEPPSTTHPGDAVFIVPELDGDRVVHVVYEGRVVNGELEQRAAVFRTEAAFWEVGDHIWETNGLTSRASYEDPWQEPQWVASGWSVRTQHGL